MKCASCGHDIPVGGKCVVINTEVICASCWEKLSNWAQANLLKR